MRELAIVGEDGLIRVESLDGARDVRIPVEGTKPSSGGSSAVCNWPTWSPDGGRIAYFRYTVASGEVRESAVCVAAADGSDLVTALSSPSASPIYMSWSPDGRRIAVLLQDGGELYLRVADVRGEREPLTVAQGAPLYFAWHPDSQGLTLNVGSGQGLATVSRLVWLRLEGGQAVRTSISRLAAPGFRAPCWAAGPGAATVAFEQGDGAELALLAAPDAAPTPLATTPRAPAFSWSPDERYLAFAGHREEEPLYAGISVVSPGDSAPRELVTLPVLAFFWARTSQEIVYVSGDLAQRTVAVRRVEVESGAVSDLGWVRPSRDLLLLFSHFDQYVQSCALVSPDGQEIALAASRAKELENGSVPTVRQILVRRLDDAGTEQAIGRGRLAFWRPAPPS